MLEAQLTFKDRIFAVTGGASGIGAACARDIIARGGKVAILDVDDAGAASLAAEIGAASFHLDVTSESCIGKAVSRVERELGPIDGAVLSAGIVQPPLPPETLTMDAFDRVISVNLRGLYISMRELASHMLRRRAGSLVAIGSITARRSTPLHAYGPAKAAVSSLVSSLAGEWGQAGIRVNAVEPGYVLTPALQDQIEKGMRDKELLAASSVLGRLVAPEEIAKAVCFLLSEDASAITGVALPVDAGYLCAGSWLPYGGVRNR